jgi:hypothetical protein
MAAAYTEGAVGFTTPAATSITCTVQPGAGRKMLLAVGLNESDADHGFNAPKLSAGGADAGWTAFSPGEADATNLACAAWWKDSDGTEGTTVVVEIADAASKKMCYVSGYATGVATGAPTDTPVTETGTATTLGGGSITPGAAGCLLWSPIANQNAESQTGPGAPWTQQTPSIEGGGASGAKIGMAVYYFVQGAAAAVEAQPTVATSRAYAGLTIALRASTGGLGATLTQTSETDAAQALSRTHQRAVGQPSEADLAQPIGRTHTRALGLASGTNAAQPITRTKSRTLGQASEADSARPITGSGPGSPPLSGTANQASETDLAQPVTRRKAKALGTPPTSTNTAQPITRTKSRALGIASETDTPQPITRRKAKALGQPSETDTARPIVGSGPGGAPIVGTVTQTSEADSARAFTRTHTRVLGEPAETDTAQPVTRRKTKAITQPSETDTARPITPFKTRALGIAVDTETARPFTKRKARLVGIAIEVDEARPITSPSTVYVPGIRITPQRVATLTHTDPATVTPKRVATISRSY